MENHPGGAEPEWEALTFMRIERSEKTKATARRPPFQNPDILRDKAPDDKGGAS